MSLYFFWHVSVCLQSWICSSSHPFIYISVNKYLWSMYYVTVTILNVGNTEGKRMHKVIIIMELPFNWRCWLFSLCFSRLTPILVPALCSRWYQHAPLAFVFLRSLNSERHQQEIKEKEIMDFTFRAQLFLDCHRLALPFTKGSEATFIIRETRLA